MIDTVLRLEDFKDMIRGAGVESDVRICVWHKSTDQYFTKCSIIISVGLYHPRKILRCIPSERIFSTIELRSPHDTPDKGKYHEWTKNMYDEIEKSLGFKPTEGFWEWGKDEETT